MYDFQEQSQTLFRATVCLSFYAPAKPSLMLQLNPPATILEKKLVLNLRLTLCALKTLLLIVWFLNMN